MTRSRARVLALVASLACLAPIRLARADGAACADAAERAQKARKANKLLDARGLVAVCAAPTCPALVKTDCQTWLLELDKEIPSIVVRARRGGRDVTEGDVEVDGRALASALDGHATPLDPGRHEVRYRRGAESLVETVVLSSGEKNRMVAFELTPPPSPTAEPAPKAPGRDATKEPAPSQTLGWVFGGVALAGIATFGVFQGLGQSDYASAKDGCGVDRTCDDATLSPIRTKLTVSGIGLGVGVAGLVALGAWFLFRGGGGPTKTAWVGPTTVTF